MSQDQPFLQQVRNGANVTLDVLLTNVSSNIGLAYDAANNALIVAEEAYVQANTAVSNDANTLVIAENAYGQANLAYAAANTANVNALAAYARANLAYANSNTAFADSGVGATTTVWGGVDKVARLTVDRRGRVTAASNVTYQTFTSTLSGIVPASGGGTTNFMRADGAWAAPSIILNSGAATDLVRTSGSGLYLLDGDLTIALAASSTYQIKALVYYLGGFGCGFGLFYNTTFARGFYNATLIRSDGQQNQYCGFTINTTVLQNFATSCMLEIEATIRTTAAGTLYYGWGTNATTATRAAGSTITATLCS